MASPPPDPLAARRERLETLRSAIAAHEVAWRAGTWTPQDDERLWSHVPGARQRFPRGNLPPCEDFVHGCVTHQFLPLPGRDLPVPPHPDSLEETQAGALEEKIRLFEDAIIAHAQPEGMELCWEHHLTLYERCLGTPDLRISLDHTPLRRLCLCLQYREGIEATRKQDGY